MSLHVYTGQALNDRECIALANDLCMPHNSMSVVLNTENHC